MNWKLLLLLSLLGLIMAGATVSLIPEKIEWIFWLIILIFCAYMIAKNCAGKYFLNGFVLSMLDCVWIMAIHITFYSTYIRNHTDMSPAHMNMPASMWSHPRELMLIMGPIFGAGFGLIQGLSAFIASKIIKKDAVSFGA